MDERIVPAATPAPPLLTFEQTEALLVAKQAQLTDLETAVRADADALLRAEADHDAAAIQADMVQLANAVVSFVQVKADYDGARTGYEASANLAGRAVPLSIGGFDLSGVKALVTNDLARVNLVLTRTSGTLPPDPNEGNSAEGPPAPPPAPAPVPAPPGLPPLQLPDMGDPIKLTNDELGLWAMWLERQIDSTRSYITDIQDRLRLAKARATKFVKDILAAPNLQVQNQLIDKLLKENERIRDSEQELKDENALLDKLRDALKQVKQEQ